MIRRVCLVVLAGIVVPVGSASAASKATVTPACAKAFKRLAVVANDPNASEDAAQVGSLTQCRDRSEWKAGAEPYRGTMFPIATSKVSLDKVLKVMCTSAPTSRVCKSK